MLPRAAHTFTPNMDVQRTQEALSLASRQLSRAVPWLDGVMLDTEGFPVTDGLSFSAGVARDIAHKLGRKPRGVIVVDTSSGAPSLPLRDAGNSSELTVRLTFATTCRVKLWVF